MAAGADSDGTYTSDLRDTGKPVLFGEQGNGSANWDATSHVRFRLRYWSAIMNQFGITTWDASGLYASGGGIPSNQYIGDVERSYIRVIAEFAAAHYRFDLVPETPSIVPTTAGESVRGYELDGPNGRFVYLHHFNSHATSATANVTVTVPGPTSRAEWVEPSTGRVLQSVGPVRGAGSWTLPSPPFEVDMLLKVEGHWHHTGPPAPAVGY